MDPTSSAPVLAHSKSTIVSRMDNYYEENSDLAIDPCHDTFIHDMAAIGYTLSADTVLPKGHEYFGHWYSSCQYRSGDFSALTESSTAPIMVPGETLAPKHEDKGWSRLAEIDGRSSIILPPAGNGKSCMVSMSTAFGSVTVTGGDYRNPNPENNCHQIMELLRQIALWIND